MSNPTTLQGLADSLTASLRSAHQRQDAAPSAGDGAYQAGYAAALADTRATVLAMIASGREVIRTVHEYPKTVAVAGPGQAQQVLTPVEECPTCGALYGEMDHAPEPCMTQAELDDSMLLRLHKAEPDLNVEHYGMCKHCGKEIKRVPGGNGPVWVHEATGMVV